MGAPYSLCCLCRHGRDYYPNKGSQAHGDYRALLVFAACIDVQAESDSDQRNRPDIESACGLDGFSFPLKFAE